MLRYTGAFSQQTIIAASGTPLFIHWTMDTANMSGTTVTDSSGNNRHGTAAASINPAWIVTGPVAQAFNINTSITASVGSQTFVKNNMTISFWASLQGSYPGLVQVYNAANVNRYTQVYSENNLVRLWIIDNNDVEQVINGPEVAYDWNHFVALVKGTAIDWYFNGTFHSSVNTPTLGTITADTVLVPYHPTFSPYATIDDVRIYEGLLTGAEITALYALGTP